MEEKEIERNAISPVILDLHYITVKRITKAKV